MVSKIKIVPVPVTISNNNVFKLASLNCNRLSSSNSTEKIKWVASQIIHSDADITSLQEISSIDVIDILRTELGTKYDISYTSTSIDNSKVHEYMLFVHKKHILSLGCSCFSEKDKQTYVGKHKLMLRAPIYGKFKILNKIDIILVAFHVNQKCPILDCQQINSSLKAIQLTNPKVKRYFIVGDFNIDCENPFAFNDITDKFSPIFDNKSIYTNTKDNQQYDNIWFQTKYFKKINESVIRNDNIEESHSDHCLIVSDFRPIKIYNNSILNILNILSKNEYKIINTPDFDTVYKKRNYHGSSIRCGNCILIF